MPVRRAAALALVLLVGAGAALLLILKPGLNSPFLKDDFTSFSAEGQLPNGAATPRAPFFLTGHVRAQGKPVASASVQVDDDVSTRTVEDGAFSLVVTRHGKHRLSAEAEAGWADAVTEEEQGIELELQAFATLEGRLTTEEGRALPGVSVTARSNGPVERKGITGPDGAFALRVPPGVYEAAFEGPGLCPRLERGLPADPTRRETVEVSAVAPAELQGDVLDADGQPVPDATLPFFLSRGCPGEASTDAAGHFQLATAAQAEPLPWVDVEGKQVPARVTRGGNHGFAIRLLSAAEAVPVVVHVVNGAGAPMPGADVFIVPQEKEEAVQAARTDASGTARAVVRHPGYFRAFASLTEGESRLHAWEDFRIENPVETTLTVDFRLVPREARIDGTVEDSRGKPLADYTVNARPATPLVPFDDAFFRPSVSGANEWLQANTDNSGHFHLGGLRARTQYELRSASLEAGPGATNAWAGESHARLILPDPERERSVSGVVRSARGSPVTSFTVLAHSVSDPGGRFAVFVQRRDRLSVRADGYAPRELALPSGHEDVDVGVVVLDDVLAVRGVVLNSRHEPVSGTRIWTEDGYDDEGTETDAAGAFVLTRLGDKPVIVHARDDAQGTAVAEARRGSAPLTLVLQQWGGISGVVYDGRDRAVGGARVVLSSEGRDALTDSSGQFSFQRVGPKGVVSAYADAHDVYDDVEVTVPSAGDAHLVLRPRSGLGKLFVVLAPRGAGRATLFSGSVTPSATRDDERLIGQRRAEDSTPEKVEDTRWQQGGVNQRFFDVSSGAWISYSNLALGHYTLVLENGEASEAFPVDITSAQPVTVNTNTGGAGR
jgi:hypothetical protein